MYSQPPVWVSIMIRLELPPLLANQSSLLESKVIEVGLNGRLSALMRTAHCSLNPALVQAIESTKAAQKNGAVRAQKPRSPPLGVVEVRVMVHVRKDCSI